MKNLLIILAFFVSCECLSQDNTLFKIITYSEGVTINGTAVVAGQNVASTAGEIYIPTGGYCGVLTPTALLFELKNTIAVSKVNDHVIQNTYVHDREGPTHRPYPPPLRLPMFDGPMNHALFGDSVFLVWWENVKTKRLADIDYDLTIIDVDGEVLEKKTIEHNWCVLDLKKALYPAGLTIITIESRETRSPSDFKIIRLPDAEEKLLHDLARVSTDDFPTLCAVFQLNGFIHDRNYLLYRIMKSNTPVSGLLKRYVDGHLSGLDLK